jgi:SAM-dependent methyltransferase
VTRTETDPRSFDRFAADYDRFASLERPDLPGWVLQAFPQHGRRALDAGCGSGLYTRAFAEQFDEVVGVDLSAPLVEIARARRPHARVTYRVADPMDLTEADGFDLVFSSTVLHHLADLGEGLRHLRDLVAPGGIAVLIDNVAFVPTPARVVYRLGAVRELPGNVRRHGWRQAWWVFGFRNSTAWLNHLRSDRYLSGRAFEERYGAAFPDAGFRSMGFAHGMIWRKPP